MADNSRSGFTAFAVIMALGLIITGLIIGGTWRKVSRSNVTITVTGSAQKEIRSDLAVWNGSFSNEGRVLTEAYQKLQESNSKVNAYLISKGFPQDKIVFSAVNTQSLYRKTADGSNTDEITGYRLSQDVSIESGEVEKIDQLSRESTELILQGIEFNSSPPMFYYTKLSDLKIEMIGLASKDAKMRADQIASSTDNEVGEVRSSRMGVIQINAKNSTDVSDYGMNDVSSLEKTITAVVTVSYSIE
jgi:uncharacterized protein